MKRYKITALMLSLAFVFASLTACSSAKGEEVKVRPQNEDDEVIEISVDESSDQSEETEETPKETKSEDTEIVTEATVVKEDFGTARYNSYMEYCGELHEENENLVFAFSLDFSFSPYQYDLVAYDPTSEEYVKYYCNNEGVMSPVGKGTAGGDLDSYAIYGALPYEEFIKLPYMMETDSEKLPEMVDSLPDGLYFGSVMAISDDATKLYLCVGEGVIFTKEEYLALKEGDKIRVDFYGTEFVTVESVDESVTDSNRVKLDSEGIWFVCGEGTTSPTDYILYTDSDNPIYINEKIVCVPVSEECQIVDYFGWLLNEGYESDMKDFQEAQGLDTLLSKTEFWYYHLTSQFSYESSCGFIPVWGFVYPVYIMDGQVVYLDLEWR